MGNEEGTIVDILSGLNGDGLKNLTWIVAIAAGLLLCLRQYRRVDLAALGAVVVFAVANVAAGIYVLCHLGDGRWGGDAHERLVAPSLAGTPMIGQFLAPVDGLLSGLAEGFNEFTDIQAALPVAAGFMGTAIWASAVAVPLCIVALVVGFIVASRQKAAFKRVTADIKRLNEEIVELRTLVGVQYV